MGGFLWEPESLDKDVFIALPEEQEKPKKRRGTEERTPEDVQAYSSFGDDGTTVTVNKYGNIIQMSRFLEFGSSGFLCVDPRHSHPYWIQSRMIDLVDSLQDREKGLRLDLVDWSKFENLPSLGFMYDRWPRYIFKLKVAKGQIKRSTDHSKSKAIADKSTLKSNQMDTATYPEALKGEIAKTAAFPLSIQYFCSRGLVIQKYLLNVGEGEINSGTVNWGNLSLTPDVCIRSLDFVERHDFNDSSQELKSSVVSDRYLILQHSSKDYEDDTSKPVHERDSQAGAALIVSAFINDNPAKIDKDHCIHLERTESQLEISVVYKLVILQEDMIEALKPLEKDQSVNKTNTAHEESNTEANGSLTGHVEDPSGADEATTKEAKNAMKRNKWGLRERRRNKSAKRSMRKIFCARNPFRKIYFAQDSRLDFAFRRNLVHILSVCSIPVYAGPLKTPSIAITCGDIAGHRVDSRASLSAIQFLCSMLKYLDPNNENSRNDRSKNKNAHLKAGDEPPMGELPESDADGRDATQHPDMRCLKKICRRVRVVLKCHLQWISTQTQPWKDGTFAPHYWATGRRINNLDYLPSPSLIDTPLQLVKVYHIIDSEIGRKDIQGNGILEWFRRKIEFEKQQHRLVSELRPKVRSWIEEMHTANERGTYTFSRKPKRNSNYYSEGDGNKGPKYCLTDHVMIGMALKCVEMLIEVGMPTKDEIDVSQQQAAGETAQSTAPKNPWCYYTHDEVRSKTLKRFTVVNTVSNQRMFATSRWSDNTRFLLHSNDTYLFFAANMEYFTGSKTPSIREPEDAKSPKFADAWRRADERWTKLLDAQSKYDEFRRLEWKKPLGYAIAFVLENMGKLGAENPSEKSARTLKPVDALNLTLLEPTWYNGLFPGRLGKQGKPAPHQRESGRDEYWFSTFELPNILWTFGSGEDATESGKAVEKHTNFVNLSHPKDKIEPKIISDDWLQKPSAILDFTLKTDPVFPRAKDADAEKRAEKIINRFHNKLPKSQLGVVIDVPRYSLGYELSRHQVTAAASFDLTTQRTVWESKKRIIWLSVRDRDVAKKVYKATRGIEKENVLAFLRRNSNFDTYFHDSATAALNVWETELHLSFFRPSYSEGEVLDRMEGTRLASTTMSLRFSGDFSDRYWTCYFLEHGTHDRKKEPTGEHVTQDGDTVTLGLRLIPREDCIIGGNLDLELSGQDLVQALKEFRRSDQSPAQALEELGISVWDLLQAFRELRYPAEDIRQALKELGYSAQDVRQALEKLGCSAQDVRQAFEELGYGAQDLKQAFEELGYSAQDLRQALEELGYPLQDTILPLEKLRGSVQDSGPVVQRLEPREMKPEARGKLRARAKRMKKDWMFLRAWQQRRVLELLIYSKMLQELHESTTQVLQLIKQLALRSEKFQDLGSKHQLFTTAIEEAKQLQKVGVEDDYDSISAKWREYAQILVVVEENLTDNIERIEQWESREKDRQNEQPRWTDQDKRNHTATILRLTILCKRQATEIDRLKRDVITFRESLPNRLETIRNDIAFRDSQNINLFTYVTVIFLPLGFAAGILSMNGAPDHHLLMNLVTLSLGALGITLFALLNAQVVKTMVSPLIDGYRVLIHTLFLWQFTKYMFFHIITERVIRKRAGKTSTHRRSNNEQKSSTLNVFSEKKNDIQRQWRQNYEGIQKFRYREAQLELQKNLEEKELGKKELEKKELEKEKFEKKLEKSLDSKNTNGITAKPQESSPQQPDTQNATFDTDLEQGKP